MSKKFSDSITERDPTKVMIVDALNMAFSFRGQTHYRDKYVHMVQSLAKSYSAGRIIIVADWGGSTFRKEILPEYKANRKEKYEIQTIAEKEAFEKFFEEYEDTLAFLSTKYEVYKYKGVEADDLAAFIVRNKSKFNISSIWLISSDRDWDLLISDTVSRFSYVTRKEITIETWPYEVPPELYVSYKCLIGDTSDNIPGIAGIGPKKAASLIEQYGDAFDIYSACPIDSKYKYIQTLNENKEIIIRNYELMDIILYCTEAIGETNVRDLEWRLNEQRSI